MENVAPLENRAREVNKDEVENKEVGKDKVYIISTAGRPIVKMLHRGDGCWRAERRQLNCFKEVIGLPPAS